MPLATLFESRPGSHKFVLLIDSVSKACPGLGSGRVRPILGDPREDSNSLSTHDSPLRFDALLEQLHVVQLKGESTGLVWAGNDDAYEPLTRGDVEVGE